MTLLSPFRASTRAAASRGAATPADTDPMPATTGRCRADRPAARTTVFAKADPLAKACIVHALRRAGHTVGYLGDGVNQAPALHAADVGLTAAGGTDPARETTDVIQLLVQNLLYDLSQLSVPWDAVDDEELAGPRRWDSRALRRFVLRLGPLSSLFDPVRCISASWP